MMLAPINANIVVKSWLLLRNSRMLYTPTVEINKDEITKSIFCPIIKPTKIDTATVDIKPILASNKIVNVSAPTETGTKYSEN